MSEIERAITSISMVLPDLREDDQIALSEGMDHLTAALVTERELENRLRVHVSGGDLEHLVDAIIAKVDDLKTSYEALIDGVTTTAERLRSGL